MALPRPLSPQHAVGERCFKGNSTKEKSEEFYSQETLTSDIIFGIKRL
jgi:hypothetical protein